MPRDDEPVSSITRIGRLDLQVHEEGIAIAPHIDAPAFDVFRTPPTNAVLVRWHELRGLALVDPWPCFRLRWKTHYGKSDDVFGPHREESAEDFAEAVSRLVDAASAHAAHLVARGWLDVPHVGWEPISAFPRLEEVHVLPDAGPFRSAANTVEKRVLGVLAERGAPSTMDALFGWLRSGPHRPLALLPRAVLVTEDGEVYVRWRDQSCARVPLAALRLRLSATPGGDPEPDDAYYVFGRATRLLLLGRSRCAVAALFDRRLADHASLPDATT